MSGESIEETMEEMFRRFIASSGSMCRIEMALFSGDLADVTKTDHGIYLRLKMVQRLSEDGEPYELTCRLFAPSGFWHIPRKKTSMMVLTPIELGGQAGTSWCIWGAQEPPTKLDLDKAYLVLDDETELLARMGGIAIKSKTNTVFGIDKDTGKFQISVANGSYVAFDPTGPSFEVVIGNGATPNAVLAAMKISPAGIEFLTANALGTTKQTWTIGSDGKFTALGTGQATLGWKAGVLVGVVSGAPKPLVVWDTVAGAPIASTLHAASG